MNIYVVKNKKGFLQVIYGDWLRAVEVTADGDIRLVDENDIDDVLNSRLPFEKLKRF